MCTDCRGVTYFHFAVQIVIFSNSSSFGPCAHVHLKSALSPVLSAFRISWIFGAAVQHTCEDLINMCQFAPSIHLMQPAIMRSLESINIESKQHVLSCFHNKNQADW